MNEIIGVIYPLPEDAIDFMFSNNRDVYVKYTSRVPIKKSKMKIKEGITLYFYQSGGDKSVVGEATIKKFDYLDVAAILNKYGGRLMISDDDIKRYAKGREYKRALVLELSGLKKYKKERELSKPVTMAGIFLTSENIQELFKDV